MKASTFKDMLSDFKDQISVKTIIILLEHIFTGELDGFNDAHLLVDRCIPQEYDELFKYLLDGGSNSLKDMYNHSYTNLMKYSLIKMYLLDCEYIFDDLYSGSALTADIVESLSGISIPLFLDYMKTLYAKDFDLNNFSVEIKGEKYYPGIMFEDALVFSGKLVDEDTYKGYFGDK